MGSDVVKVLTEGESSVLAKPHCCTAQQLKSISCYLLMQVMLAQTLVGAKRTLMVRMLPVTYSGHPFMLKSTGTLVTPPPHTQTPASLYLLVCQMLIFGMMPLPLQLWPPQADVWAC